MSVGVRALLCGLLTFLITLLIAKPVIGLMKKLKAGQTVLGYVEQHSYKTGTPTIGGIMFILPAAAVSLIFGYSNLAMVAVAVTLSYGLLGFLDDYLKVRHKENLGLRAYQKIIGQLGIAIIITFFCFRNSLIGSEINIPFTSLTVDLKWWYVPFTIFIFIALTNAVNLTDGLDGLASTVSAIYFVTFFVIILFQISALSQAGQANAAKEFGGLAVFTCCFLGGLLGFLCFNSYPSKIMMGDTGSLALGGVATVVAVFTKNPLIILLVGIMFVVSCISVVMQVIYFKLTKKRIFLMSPYHHHLEKKGLPETKIVSLYGIITALAAALSIISAGVL